MSSIVDFAETSSYATNVINGFDIVGMDKSETIISDSLRDDTISRGTINDLIEQTPSFDFMNGEAIEEEQSLGTDNDAIVDEITSELVENSDAKELLSGISGKDIFALEFFNDGDFDLSNSKAVIKGLSDSGDVQYDEKSGTLSINGQELAQLDVALDLNDDNYEIF